jgi:transcriptional regulator with XRE-family HTH domain
MNDPYLVSDRALSKEIGQKIKQLRLGANMSQTVLAERCGLSDFSISQIENGKNTSVLSLLMVLRALNALDMLYRFFEEEPMSPIAYAEVMRKTRKPQRIRKITNRKSPIENRDSEW